MKKAYNSSCLDGNSTYLIDGDAKRLLKAVHLIKRFFFFNDVISNYFFG